MAGQQPISPRELLNSSATSYLITPLPTIATLTTLLATVQQPTYDPAGQVSWCRDVLSIADKQRGGDPASTDPNAPLPPFNYDPSLQRLIDTALPMLLKLAARRKPMSSFMPGYVSEAMYLCGVYEANGAFPEHIAHNPQGAFSRFESAAKGGYHAAWYRLGSDYERFGDNAHAKECFERGAKHDVPSCIYRVGVAWLLGQLGFPGSIELGLPLLKEAAGLATVDTPEPAYTWALILLNEYTAAPVSPALLEPHLPTGTSPAAEARTYLERAAYLNYAPAQLRLGRAYELAEDPFPFDALHSVQFYELASRQGDPQGDMALSKWFLSGCEDVFDKDEVLAYELAERAAEKGLPAAQFAMGYYAEIGIGCAQDKARAEQWYSMASGGGNADASERLQALSRSRTLTRQEHEQITDSQLVRKRTQARMRSQAGKAGSAPSDGSSEPSGQPQQPAAAPPPRQDRPDYQGPQTFEAMGIHTQKLEAKNSECLVM
ncbi:HCP-like protein [Wolfiporia cocos MD-104 SS10]|uniref:HCP-like protein n=1 Tax=Wolfiporia cocos (strain MD-104) TaxID=742152 RepID=A0A2H3J3U5_WOLCO|nr:HCP-like protein [Wolfiporia cocos MD-104 SS10]